MRMDFFGDSFDVVKRFLLRELVPDADWAALPMFTHAVTPEQVARFSAFLGARVLSSDVLTPRTDRAAYFSVATHVGQLFLDPDTGIRLAPCRGAKAPRYVFGPEVIDLCLQAPARLVVAFDQSLPRGGRGHALLAKLGYFREAGVHGFAYESHACFVVLSTSEERTDAARSRLSASGLPDTRIVRAQ